MLLYAEILIRILRKDNRLTCKQNCSVFFSIDDVADQDGAVCGRENMELRTDGEPPHEELQD